MDTQKKKNTKNNPLVTANLINRLFFWWTAKFFYKGARHKLNLDDLYEPVKNDESERLGNKLEREWNKELEKLKPTASDPTDDGKKMKKEQPSLIGAIFRTFALKYFYVGLLILLQSAILRSMQPIFQGYVMQYFSDGNSSQLPTKNEALGYATGLVLTTLGVVFIMHHNNLDGQQIGMRVRVACSSLVYRKALRLSKSSLDQTAAGQVVNLLSNDVNRFDLLPIFLNYIWIMPFQLLIVGYIMWQRVAVNTLIGIGTLIALAIPLQGYLSWVGGDLRARTANLTDRRVQLMSELIAGIQVVKMYAWEKPFEKIVSMTRAREIGVLTKTSYIRALYLGVMFFTERTCLFVTLVAFVLMGNTLTANTSFVLSSYFNILELTVAVMFPQALILCGEAYISVKRLEEFLLLDEVNNVEDSSLTIKNRPVVDYESPKKPVSVELERLSANWVTGALPPTLCDVSIKVPGGNLCALVGPVGSGKSSLLHILLRELPIGAGSVKLLQYTDEKSDNKYQWARGFIKDNPELQISYASQDAWLFGGTVRENILFGQEFDKDRYEEVTKVCALHRDFRQFPEGDMTVVGERGAALSGGQRARINLARAIYRKADLYLLDDPLSAVDSRVGRHLFKNCIIDYLNGKTRILVTHQLQFLKQADTIVMMDRGAAKHQGSWDELTKSCPDFKEMLDRIEEEKKETQPTEQLEESTPNESQHSDEEKSLIAATDKLSTAILEKGRRASIRSQDSYHVTEEEIPNGSGTGEDDEKLIVGRMSNKVYISYFKAGSGFFVLFTLVVNMILAQVAASGADYWLSYWTNIEAARTALNVANSTEPLKAYSSVVNNTLFAYFEILDKDGLLPTNYSVYIYTFCIVTSMILTMTRCFLFMKICMRAGKNLHNKMFANILLATMRFFNTNPSGRILNRFSKDVGAMDEHLTRAMLEALQIFILLIGILVMIAIVNYWMIIPMIVIAFLFYVIRLHYLSTAQTIKRLEGITKSPVFSHVNATLNGLTTIRSSGQEIQEILRKEFDRCQDKHTAAYFAFIATTSAFGLILDIISTIFIACVCYTSILIDPDESFSGYVGLAISQSLFLTGMLQYGIKQTTEVQSQMTSVERILEYTNLPKEGPMTSSNPPPPTWPSTGRVQLRNVFMRYNPQDPPVLKDLNVVIEPGWKVGVVGRTGAGKSSLIGVLFRLAGDGLEGEVKIDDIDTANIGLHELRSCISIIPQEPVLFSESLRYNLDPFGNFPDSALWDALREVELGDADLDQRVTEGGTNFSVGQRQLICLARAILRNNKVLVLDEATANIDARTDALIQKTIRSKFANCTVITIAHRLNTIIDSDRVLVMDSGRIVEFGTPYELLFEKEGGVFLQMIQQTGDVMAKSLMNIAASLYRRSDTRPQISSL